MGKKKKNRKVDKGRRQFQEEIQIANQQTK